MVVISRKFISKLNADEPMRIMLCGANDVAQILPFFNEVSQDLGFQPLNFINGDIMYHNHGNKKWIRNSKLTVQNADVLVFIINSDYGKITWDTEFEEAVTNGKNFIVLCNADIYQSYRQPGNIKEQFSKTEENKEVDLIYQLIQKIELESQITIITFRLEEFAVILKKQLLILFRNGLGLLEKENRKDSFLPLLEASRFNGFPKKFINKRNDILIKELLFDFFEKKEIRKRALDYFLVSKALNEDEIIEICRDHEQGVSRKAIQSINQLVTKKHDLTQIFSEIIPSIANEEVGAVRRAIGSFIQLDLAMSIEYFHHFFPSTDVGTPRRIILEFRDRITDLRNILKKNKNLRKPFIDLINLCLNYKAETGGWKEQADLLLKEFDNTIKGSKTKKQL